MPGVVTPCVGGWIEISNLLVLYIIYIVTPCVGVWIEIILISPCIYTVLVTPCVGVWIEILQNISRYISTSRHSLRGSVD